MTSSVNTAIPLDDVPAVKSDFRANWTTIKSEIDALQAAIAPFVNASGSQAAQPSGGNWKLTGNVTALPFSNGWWGDYTNTSGTPRTITPAASAQCIVIETGTTAASVTVNNNKGVHVRGDGTNLIVYGDVA